MTTLPHSAALEFHPLADVFPLLEGDEFAAMVADIRANGLDDPVVLYEGKILDGRNRYRACEAAGVACRFEQYTGDNPVGFVISKNLRRRHLDESGRAMAAAKLATLAHGQRQTGKFADVLTQGEAAALLNVSERTVRHARVVLDHGAPELRQAVERGAVSVSGAADRIRQGIVTGVAMHPYAERGLDLYETPAPATRALLAAETLDGTTWECANGRGAISRVLRAAGYRVVATDIEDYGCAEAQSGVDFLKQSAAPDGVTTILTNPPFMHANEFVRHALTLVPRAVFLLRLAFLEGVARSDLLDGGQLARVYVFRNRLPMLHRDGWNGPRTESSAMPLAWFVWHRDHHGPTEVHRISWEPGDKAPPLAAREAAE